ncbi:ABC transporter permease [Streptomyces prunicolor]|uniref:ABC transporter permease n=1 Tax=Streptomyces prunicolor TaxID=67348 RepID=UPI0037CD26F5
MNRRQELTLGGLGALLAFGACEAVGRAGIVRRSYLPPASEVLARAVELAGDRTFLDDVAVTLRAWALGLGLACAIAIPLGLLLGSVPVVDDAVRAVIEFLRPLPSVALIPLVSLLLGTGTETEVTLITYASIWPILFNTVYGLGETDPLAKDTLRTFGFGRLSILLRVELPATAPFIVAGLRISAATALVLATATELLSGFGQGLGIFIAQAQLATDGTRDVLAGVVWAGVLGLVINGVLVWGERRAFPWRAGARGTPGAARGTSRRRPGGGGVARRGGSDGAGPPGSVAGARGGPDDVGADAPGAAPLGGVTGGPSGCGGEEAADGGRGGAGRDGHCVGRRGRFGGVAPKGSAAGTRGGSDGAGADAPDAASAGGAIGRPPERAEGEAADGEAPT